MGRRRHGYAELVRPSSPLIVLLLVALIGCGSDDDAGGGAGGSKPEQERGGIALADYVARADTICKEGRIESREKLAPLAEKIQSSGGKPSTGDVMELNAAAIEVVEPMLRELEALPKPREKRREAEAYLKANRDTIDQLEQAVEAYEDGNEREAVAALERNRDLAFALTNAAGAVGFKECGREFQQ
jgi:hypothetical protein